MNALKADFLKTAYIPLLKSIAADTKGRWGKMTVQQMIEHFADAVRVAAGKVPGIPIITSAEALPKMRAFLMSDKPFRENTPNPLLPQTPAPVRHASIELALEELQGELVLFFKAFTANEQLLTPNPFFGNLDFEMNVQLLHKHALHHLRQFGVEVAKAES